MTPPLRAPARAVAAALLVLLAVAALAARPASAAAAPAVVLSAPAGAVAATEPVAVEVTIANPDATALALPAYLTPQDGIVAPIFDVALDGTPTAYTGIVGKRGPAGPAELVVIAPGASRTWTVDLAAAYDLARTAAYTVRYHAVGDGLALVSEPLVLEVAGRPAGQRATVETVGGQGCSPAQLATLETARADASTYAAAASAYFASRRAGARYTHWFGTYDATRWATVASHYAAIAAVAAGSQIVVDCTCVDPGYYAYVYPTAPYVVYVCGMFWSAPATGTDSKAGTLIHELSHFDVVAGTDDWVYGQSGAASLAVSNPARAVQNADSHEYFAENTPAIADNAPADALSATAHAFGDVEQGTTGAAFRVTVTSTGDVAVSIGTLAVTGPFALGADTCTGASLAPSATCFVDVSFAPVAVGAASGSLAIPSSGAAAIPSVALSGTGTAPTGDHTPPTITITGPGAGAARQKTITAATDEGVLEAARTTGGVCDASLAFDAYAPAVFTSEADNGTRVCFTAADALGNVAYALSDAVAGIDTTPPTITISGPDGGPSVAASADEGALEAAPTRGDACDGSLPFAAYAPITFTDLADDGVRVCYRAGDAAGNVAYALSDAVVVDGLDHVPPTITIDGPAAGPARSKTVAAHADEGVLAGAETRGATCDGTLAFAAYAPRTFDREADDGSRVCFRAEDAAGNVTFALSAAVAGIDRTPPATTLTAVPASPTAATTARVSFTGAPDASGPLAFTCRLDGGPAVACTSPRTLTGLAVGAHVLVVAATDRAGNVEAAPPSAAWTVRAPAVDRVVNGGFESAGPGRIPAGWTATRPGTGGRTTAAARAGSAALRLTGARGVTRTVGQGIAAGGGAGTRLALAYAVRAAALPRAGTCAVRVRLYAGSRVVRTTRAACGTGAGWRLRTATITAPAAFTRVQVAVVLATARGSATFDEVRLSW